jgi:hypothetical protein
MDAIEVCDRYVRRKVHTSNVLQLCIPEVQNWGKGEGGSNHISGAFGGTYRRFALEEGSKGNLRFPLKIDPFFSSFIIQQNNIIY